MNIIATIEEIAISGEVCIKRCSVSTLYRWCRAVNEHLKKNNYGWHVKANKNTMTIRMKGDYYG